MALWPGAAATRHPASLVDLVGALVWIVTACIIAAAVLPLAVAGIVTTSGVAVAILGFALRDMLASLFAGVALNLERPYQIGDWVEVEPGPAARIVEVGWLTTRAVTRDGIGVVLPNAHLATRSFRNYSRPEPQFREILRAPDLRPRARGSMRSRKVLPPPRPCTSRTRSARV